MEVVYSFWDGSGHRKAIEVKKGCTIGKFLEYAKLQLSPDFPEIRGISADSLMYVKEDLIIPLVSGECYHHLCDAQAYSLSLSLCLCGNIISCVVRYSMCLSMI